MSQDVIRLFKHRTLTRAISELKDGCMMFASADSLNDTLEQHFDMADAASFFSDVSAAWLKIRTVQQEETSAPLVNKPDSNFEEINARENERFRAFLGGCGIYSTVTRPNNQALWAYYSGGPTGVCYELEFTREVMEAHQLIVSPVIYSEERMPFNRGKALADEMLKAHEADPCSLDELLARFAAEEPRRRWGIQAAVSALSRKHIDWQHEQEVRVISPRSGMREILNDCLKRVHLWWPDGSSDELMKALVRHPNVELMLWHYEDARMVATEAKWRPAPPSKP